MPGLAPFRHLNLRRLAMRPSRQIEHVPIARWSFASNGPNGDGLIDDFGGVVATSTRGSTGTFVGADQLITTAAINAPRFTHDPVTGKSLGLLVESARTNHIINSENLAAWNIRGTATVTQNDTVSPRGDNSADKLENIGSSGNDVFQLTSGFVNNTTLSPTLFIKKISSTGLMTLANAQSSGDGGWTINLANIGSGWERITEDHIAVTVDIPFVANSSGNAGLHIYSQAGTLDFYIWGAQLEASTFATSYIATAGSTVTRSGDNIEFSDSVFGRTNGALMIAFRSINIDDIDMFLEGGVSAVQGYSMLQDNGSNPRVLWRDGSANRGDRTATDLDFVEGADQKMATSWDTSLANAGQLIALDGVAAASYTDAVVGQADFDGTMNLGSRYDGTLPIDMIFKELVFYSAPLSNEQLAALTL